MVFSIVTFAVSLTVSEIRAVVMLKTTFLYVPLILYLTLTLKVGMRRNYAPENYRPGDATNGEEIMIVGRAMCQSVTGRRMDGRTDRFRMTKIASHGKKWRTAKIIINTRSPDMSGIC